MFAGIFTRRVWFAVALVSLAHAGSGCAAWSAASPADSGNAYAEVAAVESVGHSLPEPAEFASRVNSGLTTPDYTIRRTVPEVRIQFTVTDDHGRLLQSLSGADFRVFDNRAAVSGLRHFSRLHDLPLDLGILVDVSDSVKKTAQSERQAAEFLLQRVFRPDTDHAALLAFSGELWLWQPSTRDRDALSRALTRPATAGYATYLYDSVIRACQEQFPPATNGESAQRVLVLITDGNDTGSLHTLDNAIAAAQRREVQIFALSVHSPKKPSEGDAILRRLADATGGEFYVASSVKDFPSVFAALDEQMRTQYSVTFQPAEQTRGFHDVKIVTADGAKVRVHARPGYFYDAP